MTLARLAALLMLTASPAAGQILPVPSADNPRLQSARFAQREQVLLTLLPETPLTVILQGDETITGVEIDEEQPFRVRVSSDRDSFIVLATQRGVVGHLAVTTDRRFYRFALRDDAGPTGALLVRFDGDMSLDRREIPTAVPLGLQQWSYRLKGDQEVLPASVLDDGTRTHVAFFERQALPAIFAIGPTGEEEVVNGYMREGIYVIDRVYDELVFRIDKEKATATRSQQPGEAP